MMLIPNLITSVSRTAWPWLKAILTIVLAGVMLMAGFLLWTTRYVPYQSEIQMVIAAFIGFAFAVLLFFGATGRRFRATAVMALIIMGAVIAAAGVVVPLEEKFGRGTTVGLFAFPLLAAVTTKAANIASQKEGDSGIYKKGVESFNAALENENIAELVLWTMAWTSGGFGVFLLTKVIKMW